ncbi:protein suppressor 2 of zeste [Anopheles ziemanni]|uniref:protein suppressor 2 of zeste n=1 Tax=Anopheles coustani TaxID=139045 RepID=UPI00265A8B50|nr:protein suppressor 2 of zeste [Anopheles coustani]XP_058178089.1 protein suppressor 2 of zeste [Anopheles ziemanni]
MTSAATMISGGTAGSGGGGDGTGTGTRASFKDSRASLVPTPDAGSVGGRSIATRSLTASPASTSLSCSSSPTLPLAGLMMHEPERVRMRSAAGSNRRRVKDFNDSITCTLCSGYLVEATTVNDCLHTFCRSCIVKYLESNKYCPRCKSYNSKPITAANLRPDRTLRALVYKLVPGLHKSENQRMVQFYADISSSNNVPFGDDQHLTQGALSLLDDQNFFSPDEPISLSLEYHYDTLAEHSAATAKVPVTYLQCPAAVTVHHLYKFILTKNGLLVGADHIRVEIIYEDEVLPSDFTLMDVAYCFGYKRIAPMRFFYRILIHSTAKPAPTTTAYHRVEGQDKNSTTTTSSSGGHDGGGADSTTHGASSPTPTAAGRTTGQQRTGERQQAKAAGTGTAAQYVRPREDDANNSSRLGASSKENAVSNGAGGLESQSSTVGYLHNGNAKQAGGKSPVAGETSEASEKPSSTVEKKTGGKSSPPTTTTAPKRGSLKMVLVSTSSSKGIKGDPATPGESKSQSPPTMKATTPLAIEPPKEHTSEKVRSQTAPENQKPASSSSELKCYVNLKKQTVVGGATPTAAEKQQQQQQHPVEIPRLKIDLPRLKAKLSVPGERHTPGGSPPSSSSSSAATSPSSAASAASGTSASGKSPVWPMGKEEYAKTIGLKPVYAVGCEVDKHGEPGGSSSSSHRKRKKGKHSKEAGSSGKRRKLHAEISSQQDASLKMKVKLTEKPPKHERLKSSGNEEEPVQAPQPIQPTATPTPPPPPPPPPMSKVIDITKDDDDVKFVNEQPPSATLKTPARRSPPQVETAAPVVTTASSSVSSMSSKDKLSEMRAIRHKPMVYIPNLDRSLSADASISSLMECVQVKAPILKPTPALIPASTASTMAGKSQPRTPILSPRTMQSYPPLAYPLTNSTATPAVSAGSLRPMAPPPMKRSISSDSGSSQQQHPSKTVRLDPPSLVSPSTPHSPANTNKQPIHAPMFNFAKGANRAKAAQQAAGTNQPQSPDVPYRSPISSSYTKEMVTKKPIPNLLLPPSSISVTKMSDMVSSSSSTSMGTMVDHRPALEIVRIPQNAPVADKPSLAPFTTPPPKLANSSGTPKTTRPPPATIPLIKIKKPTTDGPATVSSSSTASTPPGMNPLRPKVGGSGSILDLSGSRRLSDEVIILDHSPAKSSTQMEGTKSNSIDRELERLAAANRRNSIPGLKLPPDMIGFPISAPSTMTSSLMTQSSGGGQKTLAPLPKLTEINRNRNMAVRQPNASIRSIPNPSALAFRGAQSAASTAVTSAGTMSLSAHSSSGMSISTASGNGNGSLVGSNNRALMAAATSLTLASMTNTFKTSVSNASSLSNGSSSRTTGASNGNTVSPPVNGGASGNNNNNNNIKIANANTTTSLGSPGSGKKTIEKVAAVLKAAAATVDSSNRGLMTTSTPTVSSAVSTTTSGSNANTGSVTSSGSPPSNGSEGKQGNGSPSRTAVNSSGSSPPTTMAMASSTNGGNRANGDTIVTSVTTSTMASVAGTNGSAKNSPASIVNVN